MRYWIVDYKTGVAWAEGGAFKDKQIADSERLRLADKYWNPDLRIVAAAR